MNVFQRAINRLVTDWDRVITHKDRVGPIDTARGYGSRAEEAYRPAITMYDLDAKNVNANVSIAIRALSDAVKSLPLNIIGTDTVGGVDRDSDDNDHPANAIINDPNPEMTIREVVSHMVKSVLGDGNAFLTIEVQTGPNKRFEIWPRDPRNVKQQLAGGKRTGYLFQYEDQKQLYKPSRVVHIRDVNPEDPMWGKARFEAVRNEIYMDYLITEFNKNFFINGATLNLMFTPKVTLSEQQHEMILDHMAKFQGAERAFKMLVSRFAGKLESPDMKHTDIAFEALLKHNREKIFGVFGLQPFRGGVMEYANYANAVAQDRDFWCNTVMPLTAMIEDALNKQLIWPYFAQGRDVRIQFDYSEVPALKGEPKERAEVYEIYVKNRIMSPKQVCEELGIDPPDEADLLPVASKPEKEDPDDDDDDAAPKATEDEEKEGENALLSLFSDQRRQLRSGLLTYTRSGALMSKLVLEDKATDDLFPVMAELDHAQNVVTPVLTGIYRNRASAWLGAVPPDDQVVAGTRLTLDHINRQTAAMLKSLFIDAIRYRWDLGQLSKRTGGIFSRERARNLGHKLVAGVVGQAASSRLIDHVTKEEC